MPRTGPPRIWLLTFETHRANASPEGRPQAVTTDGIAASSRVSAPVALQALRRLLPQGGTAPRRHRTVTELP